MSNQSAAVKQGEALGLAIQRVLNKTNADKVILMGHSMGGLAIREYLQNSYHWKYDGSHHRVAKAITIGTPHRGSDVGVITGSILGQFFGKDMLSEAVRDLRTDTPRGINDRGVFLYGGDEPSILSPYYNTDVNCDGDANDYNLVGLNSKSFPRNLPYTCLIGTTGYGTGGDLIVSQYSANLNNVNSSYNSDVFYLDFSDRETNAIKDIIWHSELPKQVRNNILTLDEPSNYSHAYELIPNRSSSYTGLFTKQSSGSLFDIDSYKSNLSKGITKITVNSVVGASPSILFADPYGSTVAMVYGTATTTSQTVVRANNYSGTYKVEVSGNAPSTWSSYNYNIYNIASPSLYATATSTCNQNASLVASVSGYDSYDWYRNGQYFATSSTHYINASTTASGATLFTVRVSKWGVTIDGLNSSQVTNYTPLSTASLTASTNGESSATVLNVCSGTPVLLSATCATNTYPVWGNGLSSNTTSTSASIYVNDPTTASYTAKCSNYFCISANSPPVRIVKDPNIQSVKAGDWQDATTWSCNCIPINCQDVSIERGHTVNVPVNDAKAKNITVKGILNFQNNAPPSNSKVSIGGI